MLHRPFSAALARARPVSQQLLTPQPPQYNPQRHRAVVQLHSCRAAGDADDAAPAPQQQLSAADKDSVLEQLELLRRQLDAAVAQEDYSRAQQLKERVDNLKQQLSPVQQYVQAQLAKLRGGSEAEKAEALKGLGEAGTSECLADLAGLLSDPELGDAASATMWRIFMRHPNTEVQKLMEHGVGFMEKGHYPLALEAFEAAAALEPSFAEAHNKRATVLYLMEKYKESIQLCELVLELNPYHFAAASGMGMCYVKLADYRGALAAFERTLRINPGLTHIQRYIVALRDQLPGAEGAAGGGGEQ